MKYLIYANVLLKKIFIYKIGIYIALILLLDGIWHGNINYIISASIFYSIIALAFIMRSYTRNVVHNYALQNNIHLPRLWERNPKLDDGVYFLEDIHEVRENNILDIFGYIKYRKISKIEYYIARFFWKWIDDDSNHDTMSGGDRTSEGMVYGNAFDLGDARASHPEFEWKESFLWFIRNIGYNSNYTDEEIAEDNKNNFYYFTKKEHWTPSLEKWNNIPYIKFYKSHWHFGFIPYSNSKRKGRCVYFAEDINKIDKDIIQKYSKQK